SFLQIESHFVPTLRALSDARLQVVAALDALDPLPPQPTPHEPNDPPGHKHEERQHACKSTVSTANPSGSGISGMVSDPAAMPRRSYRAVGMGGTTSVSMP